MLLAFCWCFSILFPNESWPAWVLLWLSDLEVILWLWRGNGFADCRLCHPGLEQRWFCLRLKELRPFQDCNEENWVKATCSVLLIEINNTARDQHGTSCSHARHYKLRWTTRQSADQGFPFSTSSRAHGRDRRTTQRGKRDRNEMKLSEIFGDVQQFDPKHQEPHTN